MKQLANPWAPAWYVHGAECLLTTRVFQTILFKSLFQLFGYNPNAFQALKALGFAGCGVGIYAMTLFLSGRRETAIGASAFFFLLPPVYRSVSWIADLEILGQMFLLISLCSFLNIYHSKKPCSVTTLSLLLIMAASAWLAMKLKETTRIIPVLSFGFLFLHQNRNLLKWLKSRLNQSLILSLSVLLFSIIPWRGGKGVELDSDSHLAVSHFDPSQLSLILSPLTNLFFAICSLGILIAILGKYFSRKSLPAPASSLKPGTYLFLGLWLSICLMGFTLNFHVVNNERYLTTLLIPLTVTTFVLFSDITRRAAQKFVWWNPLFFLSLAATLILQGNLDEITFRRNFYSGTDIADWVLTREIAKDRFGISRVTWQDLDNFYRGKLTGDPKAFTEIRIKEWDENMKSKLTPEELAGIAEKWGGAYILSFKEGLFSDQPKVKQIFRSNTANGSLYTRLMPKIKKKTLRPIYLYKYTTPETPPAPA